MAQILIKYRSQVFSSSAIEKRYYVFSHYVLIFELLIELANQRKSAIIVINDASQCVQEQRAFEIHILRRLGIYSTRRNDWSLVAHFRLVTVRILQTIGFAKHVFHVKTLKVGCPSFVNPHVRRIGCGDTVAKPLMSTFVNDDEIKSRTYAHAGPISFKITIGEMVPVGDGALMFHAGVWSLN